jgi:predicted acylesterase/phospholipase RssA
LLGDAAPLALATHRGKVGLALSGGGFRASLFHLGVLARLAEVDALRSVEVISTVSGGSIVGAHYYLEVQRHLESHPDRDISADDYVTIVRRVQEQFLAGVQTNIRVHALANLVTNLKVAFARGYTYSRRLGELYERVLYAKVADHKGERERLMTELMIAPAPKPPLGAEPFKPKLSNFRRRAKVPVVLINATSLNSGHNWQFTARSMGEPPGRLNTDVDANARYRRLWYHEAPTPDLERFRLGYAVAASACVPGLFEPIVLEDLYEDRVVRLTDGGVHDNQGVAGLLDEGCTLFYVSDASGQMDDLAHPPNGRLGVPLRANSILMDRVREAEYEDLENRVDSRALQGLLFVHLKQDLDIEPVTWKQKPGAPEATLPSRSALAPKSTTRYGIDKDLQRKLAALRTDLDSFTEIEAHALMLSGYLMTTHELKRLDLAHHDASASGTWADLDIDAQRLDWPFLALREVMRRPENPADLQRTELARQLEIGSALLFKAWRLHRGLRVVSYVLGAVALAGLAYLWWQHRTDVVTLPSYTVGALVLSVLVFVALLVFPMLRWLRPQKVARDGLLKLALAFGAFLFAWLHLLFVEPFFLSAGRLKRLLTLK